MAILFVLLTLLLNDGGPAGPWVVASAEVDVDGDGLPDSVRIETSDPKRTIDEEPCAGCGDRVEGHFVAVVTLSKTRRVVRTPVTLHPAVVDTMWFWYGSGSGLAIADYNGDGRPDVNLGQFTNSLKWEYGLFTIQRNGRVERFAVDRPAIYVSPGDAASTDAIEAIPGGMRFRDFDNSGESPGERIFTCLWQKEREAFRCSMTRAAAP